jgi:hypothetical protein
MIACFYCKACGDYPSRWVLCAPILDLGTGPMLPIVQIETKAPINVALDTLKVFTLLPLIHFLADVLGI